jgi:hypothetical protein
LDQRADAEGVHHGADPDAAAQQPAAGRHATLPRPRSDVPPGPRFGVDGTLKRFLRVPYTLPEEQLTEAVELLARAWLAVTGATARKPGAVVI